MYVCNHCGRITNKGKYSQNNRFVCDECKDVSNILHTNLCYIKNGEVHSTSPFSSYEEKDQRALFIDYAYKLFNNKLNPAAYKLMNKYIEKGCTWLGMVRSLEWFYVIKKNSIVKAKNNIGIIPYVYDEAQKFYTFQEYNNKRVLQAHLNSSKKVQQETVVKLQEKKKVSTIDLTTL